MVLMLPLFNKILLLPESTETVPPFWVPLVLASIAEFPSTLIRPPLLLMLTSPPRPEAAVVLVAALT